MFLMSGEKQKNGLLHSRRLSSRSYLRQFGGCRQSSFIYCTETDIHMSRLKTILKIFHILFSYFVYGTVVDTNRFYVLFLITINTRVHFTYGLLCCALISVVLSFIARCILLRCFHIFINVYCFLLPIHIGLSTKRL